MRWFSARFSGRATSINFIKLITWNSVIKSVFLIGFGVDGLSIIVGAASLNVGGGRHFH